MSLQLLSPFDEVSIASASSASSIRGDSDAKLDESLLVLAMLFLVFHLRQNEPHNDLWKTNLRQALQHASSQASCLLLSSATLRCSSSRGQSCGRKPPARSLALQTAFLGRRCMTCAARNLSQNNQ
eukprot:5527379-Amphidinium_carterae.1